MNLEKLNPWFTFLSNVGVIVGLLFLGLEIRQNAEATRFEIVQANRVQRIEGLRANRDPQWAAIMVKARAGGVLTPEEAYQYDQHVRMSWGLAYFEWVQREMGMADEYVTSDEVPMRSLINGFPGSLDWVRQDGPGLYPPAFMEYVEQWAARLGAD